MAALNVVANKGLLLGFRQGLAAQRVDVAEIDLMLESAEADVVAPTADAAGMSE